MISSTQILRESTNELVVARELQQDGRMKLFLHPVNFRTMQSAADNKYRNWTSPSSGAFVCQQSVFDLPPGCPDLWSRSLGQLARASRRSSAPSSPSTSR